MRKLVTLLALLGFAITANSKQFIVPKQDDLKKFKQTKTIVFLENNATSVVNSILKETVEKYWKITPYEFMTYDKKAYDTLRTKSDLSFLTLGPTIIDKDKKITEYLYLYVTLGGDYTGVKEMPTIAAMPVSYDRSDESEFDYKISVIIRFIEKHITFLTENPQIKKPKKALKHYHANMKNVHNKTLYFTKDELVPALTTEPVPNKKPKELDLDKIEAKIKVIYPHSIKITDTDDIEKVVENKDPKAAILHQVSPHQRKRAQARCWNIIFNADTADMYFFSSFMIDKDKRPQGLSQKELKRLAKGK